MLNYQSNLRFIGIVFFFFIELSSALTVSAQNLGKKHTYVLVHGAWGGGWSFSKVEFLLVSKGHRVYRPTLTGLGERVHLASPRIGLQTHIDDVKNVFLFEELKEVILLGHSYGGMVVTGVADQLLDRTDRIKQLIYLDAFVPNDGESLMGILRETGFDKKLPPAKNGLLAPFWLKDKGDKLPHDVPQSLKTFTDLISMKHKDGVAKLPSSYILTVEKGKKPQEDTFYKYSEQAKKKGWSYYQMEADHFPQSSAPEELAKILDQQP